MRLAMRCSSPCGGAKPLPHKITIAESWRGTRGAFYDQTGALRDMVQNHAASLLCAIGMEPPINSSANAIRDEKLKVLQSLKPWSMETIGQPVIRGQYAAGKHQAKWCRLREEKAWRR